MRRDRRIQLLVFLIAAIRCVAATPAQADKIVIIKSARTLTLLSGSKVLKTYKVALGSVPVGPKLAEGDHKTPEGNYVIDAKNLHSQFHLSGGAIMIHGLATPFAYLEPLAPPNRLDGWLHRRDERRD